MILNTQTQLLCMKTKNKSPNKTLKTKNKVKKKLTQFAKTKKLLKSLEKLNVPANYGRTLNKLDNAIEKRERELSSSNLGMNKKLAQLKEKYRVKISHLRYTKPKLVHANEIEDKSEISPKGGLTIIRVLDKETGKLIRKFRSRCCPEDNFVKRIGLDIAVGRAHKHLTEIPIKTPEMDVKAGRSNLFLT